MKLIIFPKEVYKQIIKYNLFKKNHGVEWIKKKDSNKFKSTTPYDHRKQIYLPNRDGFISTKEERDFWSKITKTFLNDKWFELLIYKKFPEYFDLRFGDFFNKKNISKFNKTLFLQRHDPNYYIGPHTDIPVRIFTCIFSFAEKRGFEEYGTQLLKHKNPMNRCWGNAHYKPKEFKVVKTCKYKPNNFLLFFKTRHSFHSVKKIKKSVPNGRYGMQYQFVEPRDGIFNDLSVPKLMSTSM